ncbi:MAG TPA: hypothetical protein VFN39_00225 [Gemmatimonadaceae bacterium]|nr:hypothetical protein [Gemmatimonadaceae bacterium]
MPTRRATIALALLALTISTSASLRAQATAPASVGERVRITTPTQRGGYRYVGSVVGVQGDSLLLQTKEMAGPRSVAIGDITALDVSLGKRGNTRRGLLYGSVIGAGLGAALAAATYQKPDCAGATWFCGDATPNRTGDAVAGGILGALTGVVVGGLWGATHPSERWVRRSLGSAARVGVAPSGRGFGVRLATRF